MRAGLLRRRFSSMWSTKDQIPRLPLPSLENTLKGYLEAVEPLVSSSELQATRALADDFVRGEGQALHRELEQLNRESSTSWVEGFWDAMYLEARSSVPVDWNPSFVLHEDPVEKGGLILPRLERASRLCIEAAVVHLAIEKETFPCDFEGTTPLHMLQHEKLFCASRIPHYGRDEVRRRHGKSTHMAVLCNGHVFKVQLLEGPFSISSAKKVMARLAHVESVASRAGKGPNWGLLTALPRDQWASARLAIESSSAHARNALQTIDEALFVLSLDPVEPGRSDLDVAAKQMLIGRDSDRWFDKWQIIITPDGQAGFNLEHSPYDGHTFVSMFNHIWDGLKKRPVERYDGSVSSDGVECLTSFQHPYLKQVEQGKLDGWRFLDDKQAQLSLKSLTLNFGTDVLKKEVRTSPDAFMQLSFQLAWARKHGKVGCTYESGQVKRFLAGRTETIRPVTAESARFALTWDTLTDGKARRKIYDEAAQKHQQRVQVAKTGAGWDRHLFALKNLARHKQQRLPDRQYRYPSLFTDPTFGKYFNIEVSTSNSGALPFRVFSFGPVIADGVGLGYQTFPHELSVCTTSYTAETASFSEDLNRAINDLRSVLKHA